MRPDDLAVFQQLVARARQFQHGTLTERQYERLLREYLRANKPITDPLFGWFYGNRERLRHGLAREGITMRPPRVPRLHGYELSRSGFGRLRELEDAVRCNAR